MIEQKNTAVPDLAQAGIPIDSLKAALNSAANAIAITDPKGNFLWANPAFASLTGWSLAEVQGRPASILKSGEHSAEFYQGLWKTVLAGRVWRGEMLNRRKDGTVYAEENTITPVRDKRGEIVNFITVKQDVTARKRAEEQIRSQAALLEVARDAITVHDLAGRVIYWNGGASRIYGWSLEEALDRFLQDLVFSRAGDAFREAERQTLEHGEWTGELYQTTKENHEIIVRSSWSLVRGIGGEPQSFLVVSTDLTEEKRLESHLMRAQRLESVGRLASGIAHDLNNVLTPIMIAVQLLRESRVGDSDAAMLNTLESCVKRGASIVQQVLVFARGTEGAKVEFSLKQAVREIACICRDTFPKSIECTAEYPEDLWAVRGNPTQVQQVLLNLCVNSRDAMPAGGRLELKAGNIVLDQSCVRIHPKARPGRFTLIQVIDTGVGMSPETQDKVFEPFFTTKPVGEGTGLGLPTALGIIEGHGGFISLYSTVGEGSVFSVYLPAIESAPALLPAEIGEEPARGNGEMILVVDDEMGIRELVRATLEEAGYRVLEASSGHGALAIHHLHRSQIRAAIVDLMMPGLSGKSLIPQLTASSPDLRIMVITGMPDELGSAVPDTLKVDATLPKPFTGENLLRVLGNLLSESVPVT